MSNQPRESAFVRRIMLAAAGAAVLSSAAAAQTTAFIDTTLTTGGTTAVVAPGQGFPITVSIRSATPIAFNAAQFLVYCTEEGLRLDDYAWSAPFVAGGRSDFSLGGALLPLIVNNDTLQGPGYPLHTPDIEFAVFDFAQSASEGQLLRLWVRAPKQLAAGSTCFIAAIPDLFTSGFTVVPVANGVPLRVEISAGNAGDVNGDGAANSSDLAALLSSWAMPDPVGQADGDLDADGDVDAEDLALLLANWT